MTPFLEYEPLTPETADPVIIRITGQRERKLDRFTASNGVGLEACAGPEYWCMGHRRTLWLLGGNKSRDRNPLVIPLADWPAVKQAIREFNEYYKEKDMKEDRYEFDLREWQYDTEPEPFELPEPTKLIVTRKKPKVEDRENIPVKVEWRAKDLNSALGRNETAHFEDYGCYRIVQFRVTGWDGGRRFDATIGVPRWGIVNITNGYNKTVISEYPLSNTDIHIGLDARDKFSCPVLLPEEVYSRLPEICAALEQKANQGG